MRQQLVEQRRLTLHHDRPRHVEPRRRQARRRPSGTGSGAVCTAREELRSSIDDLKNVDVVKNGTAGIQTALTNVKKSLQDVKASASSELQPQVKAFEDAVNQLEEALKNVSSGGVSAVVSAAKDVGTTGSTLLTGLQDVKC